MFKGGLKDQFSEQETAQRRDKLLRRLLHTAPQPRPKRERGNGEVYPDSRFPRQRRKALAFCLGVRGLVRLPIVQTLALGSAQQFVCPFRVGDFASVVTKIEFSQIAIKVGLAH